MALKLVIQHFNSFHHGKNQCHSALVGYDLDIRRFLMSLFDRHLDVWIKTIKSLIFMFRTFLFLKLYLRMTFSFEIAFVWKSSCALCRCNLYILHYQRGIWDAFMNDISTPFTRMILAPSQEKSGQDSDRSDSSFIRYSWYSYCLSRLLINVLLLLCSFPLALSWTYLMLFQVEYLRILSY